VLAADGLHSGLLACVGDLARLYHTEPALHDGDTDPHGFQWIDCTDWEASVIAYLRRARDGRAAVVVANLTPVVRHGYRIGVPHGGGWREAFNSDAAAYGGSGVGNLGGVDAESRAMHGLDHSIALTLPPLSIEVFLPPDPPRG